MTSIDVARLAQSPSPIATLALESVLVLII